MLDGKFVQEIHHGSATRISGFRSRQSERLSSWGLLRELDTLNSKRINGTEIDYSSNIPQLSQLLQKGGEGAHFTTCFGVQYFQKDRWAELARNKYGESVAGVLIGNQDVTPGVTLLLPQMPNMHEIVVRLIEEWCPVWSPHLFPYHEGSQWLRRPEYEVPQITNLRREIEELQTAHESQIATLKDKVENIHASSSDWYALQNGTGEALVVAVANAMKALGFKQIVDVDAEAIEKALKVHCGRTCGFTTTALS